MSNMGSRTAGRRARRQFSEEFRIGAVRLILGEGKTVGAVARELDLTPSALAQWVKQARADRTKGKAGLTTEERAELARPRDETRSCVLCGTVGAVTTEYQCDSSSKRPRSSVVFAARRRGMR